MRGQDPSDDDFRGQLTAAPLKPHCRVNFRFSGGYFRGQLTAAPLKPGLFGRCWLTSRWHFRGQLTAAPLKPL